MINLKISGDRQLIQRFRAMPSALHDSILRKVTSLTLQLENRVKGKLSDDVLHVRTGKLHASVFSEVVDTPNRVVGIVGAGRGVAYAAIHEFGGVVRIPEVVPTNAKALHWVTGGKDVFVMRARAHDVVIPQRSYLRSSLDDMKGQILEELTTAARQGMNPHG